MNYRNEARKLFFLMMIEDPEKRSLLEEIYITYKKDLYLTAYDMVKKPEVAEDIFHTAIIKASKHLEKISDVKSKSTRSYLVSIVMNLCRDYFKEDKVKGVHMLHSIPIDDMRTLNDTKYLVEEGFLKKELMMEISRLIDQIHPSYSEVLRMRYYEELCIKDIAEMLGTTENNVSVRINRGIKAMRKLYFERSENNDGIIAKTERA